MTALHPTANSILANPSSQIVGHNKTMSSSIAVDAGKVDDTQREASQKKEIDFGGQHIFNTNSVQSDSQKQMLSGIYPLPQEQEQQRGVSSQLGVFMPGLQYVHLPPY